MVDVLRRNNVIITGKGEKAMLFAHGFGCDQSAWQYISDAFIEDYKLVFIDYVGAGKSDLSTYDVVKYDSLDGYASDILEICAAIDYKKVIFVGHSVSCMVGLLASIRDPEVFDKLILISPSPSYISSGDYEGGFDQETIDSLLEVMEEDYISWARSLAPSIMNESNGSNLTEQLTDSFCSIDPVIAKQFAKVTFTSDNREDLKLVRVNSLTIQVTDDMIAPITVGEYINVNTPGNSLVLLDGSGHCPHMSHPRETIELIKNYLSN